MSSGGGRTEVGWLLRRLLRWRWALTIARRARFDFRCGLLQGMQSRCEAQGSQLLRDLARVDGVHDDHVGRRARSERVGCDHRLGGHRDEAVVLVGVDIDHGPGKRVTTEYGESQNQ